MKKMPTIKSVMTPFPHHVEIDLPLDRAREEMARHAISHLPVMQDGRLVGVLSDRDIGLVSLGAKRRGKLRVRDACTLDAYVVSLAEPLDRVLTEMASRHLGSVLVVKGDRLAGIFTVTDACRHFAAFLQERFPEPPDDEIA